MSLFRIPGGLVLAVPTAAASSDSVQRCALPARLYLPLVQERGQALQCRVQVGQTVHRGEALAYDTDAEATVLPAPTSGHIVAIESLTLAHATAPEVPTLVLQADGHDEAMPLPPLADWAQRPPAELRQRLAQAGIVGLGGAAYPAAAKLERTVALLVLNGAECEPYIACDEALMRGRAAEVVAGAAILAHIVAAGDVVIALEERMTAAAEALQLALAGQTRIRLQRVPTVYPQGGERQLVQTLCGREVPSGAYPADIGVLVHNVATAAAAWRAVVLGEALTSRLVSLGGRGVRRPGVFEVRIGTLIEHLIDSGGGYTEQAARLILGGPLMGLALPHDRIALGRGANSVLVLGADDVRARAGTSECIRCGECARVCPVQLQPQELWRVLRQGDIGQATGLGLRDCIECGCCAYVCPSQIGLVDEYRAAKSALAMAAEQRRRADHARQRYNARKLRLAREQADKVARVAARREEVATLQSAAADIDAMAAAAPAEAASSTPPGSAPQSMDKSAVLAAIARGKAKRAAAPAPPAAPPPQTEP